jgi:hypothetical protein
MDQAPNQLVGSVRLVEPAGHSGAVILVLHHAQKIRCKESSTIHLPFTETAPIVEKFCPALRARERASAIVVPNAGEIVIGEASD